MAIVNRISEQEYRERGDRTGKRTPLNRPPGIGRSQSSSRTSPVTNCDQGVGTSHAQRDQGAPICANDLHA
jgi:hypothetical protein